MRYNRVNNKTFTHKAIACSVTSTTRNLTQPTDVGGRLGWLIIPTSTLAPWWDSIWALLIHRAGLLIRVPHQGVSMFTHELPTVISRQHTVTVLTHLRQEWQQAANGISLVQIEANVAMLLADIAMSLGLDSIELTQVFGADLFGEIEYILTTELGNNGRH